ncbi:MAG: AMP-binding protein [Desulfocucumaceae bacterium]
MKPVRFDHKEDSEFRRMGYWTGQIFSDYWDENASRFPDKEALIDSAGSRLTWAQANRQIDRLAMGLAGLGLEKDDRVAIQLPNRVEGFISRVACEKAGVISIALMHVYRHSELTEILGRIEASAVIIPRKYRNFDYYEMIREIMPSLPGLKYIIVVGDQVPEGAISYSDIIQRPMEDEYSPGFLDARRLKSTDVGFLTSTTGTTGLPKIVEWTIAARLWSSKTHTQNWRLSSDDVVCAVAPWPGSPGGTPTYFVAPQVGARIALLYEYTPVGALEFFEKEKVTVPCVVPAQLAAMMQEPLEKYDLSSLRIIRCSGGYLSPALAEEVERRMGCPILSTYGSQDTGSISGTHIEDPPEKRRATVGRPLVGNEIRLVDDQGQEVPRGEVGLLYFRGPQSSSGYYRDPSKTFSEAVDEGGWACPGDLAKIDDEGYIVIAGRKKDIIIRGGQNIYPGEIESLLIAHPKVSNAAVVAMPDPVMGEKACAFVIPAGHSDPPGFSEILDYLKTKKLAMYKLPERLEVVESFPLAGDSKINKAALRQMVADKLLEEGKTRQ